MKFLNKNLVEAERGSKADIESFEQLGINIEKLQLLDKKEQFLVVAEAIKRLGDESLQTDAAMNIFGKGGTALLPLFQEGIAGIKDLMKEAETNGIGISDEDAVKSERLNDSLNRMSRSLQGVRLAFTSVFSDSISDALDQITSITKGIREWIKDNQSLVRTLTPIAGLFAGWKVYAVGIGLVRSTYAALLPVSAAAVASEQANATAATSTTAAVTAETQALAANTAATKANVTAKAQEILTKAQAAKASITNKISGLDKTLDRQTNHKAALQAELAMTAGMRKRTADQQLINSFKIKEASINQKIVATESQINAIQKKRTALQSAELTATSKIARAKQSMAATNVASEFGAFSARASTLADAQSVAITKYLTQMGLAQTATNRWAASIRTMSNAEAAAAAKSALAARMTALTQIFTRQRQAVVTVTVAETASVAVRQAVTFATIRQTVANTACAASMNLLGLATKGAAAVFLALKASMMANPVMWIVGAVAAVAGLASWLTIAMEKHAELRDEMSNARDKGDKDRAFDAKKAQRLQQLSEKPNLNDAEMKEAKKLVAELTGQYGDFGAKIDEVAGKLNLAADAMDKLTEARNRQSLQQREAELREARANLDEINKEGEYIMKRWQWFKGDKARAKDLETWFEEKKRPALKREHAIKKEIDQLKGGANTLDVAKGPEAVLDENLAKGQGSSNEQKRELEDAENGLARIQRDRAREQSTAIANEIADLKDRNKEYKKFLKLLIETEQAKVKDQSNLQDIPKAITTLKEEKEKLKKEATKTVNDVEVISPEDTKKIQAMEEEITKLQKIANWQKELNTSDMALDTDINRLRDKNKIDAEKFAMMPLTMDVSEKRAALNVAVEGGDTSKIQKARAELEEAKKNLEMTSYKHVKAALDQSRDEYNQALEAFQKAKESGNVEGLAIAESQLKEASDKYENLNSRFENLSERQFDKNVQSITQSAITQGTFNKADIMGGALAYMASEKNTMEDVAENTEKTNDLLKELNGNVRRGGGMVYA
jgi:DNA repair exonuclease SbcCD ATPase subunit